MLLLRWRQESCGLEVIGQEEESYYRCHDSLDDVSSVLRTKRFGAAIRFTSSPSITKIHLQLDKPPRVPISAKPRASKPPKAPEREAAV